jgi:hypothetical protein
MILASLTPFCLLHLTGSSHLSLELVLSDREEAILPRLFAHWIRWIRWRVLKTTTTTHRKKKRKKKDARKLLAVRPFV